MFGLMRGPPSADNRGRRTPFVDASFDPQPILTVAAWVVALLFGKHLQTGYADWRQARLAQQPIRRDK
jgi:hypothetical protein